MIFDCKKKLWWITKFI